MAKTKIEWTETTWNPVTGCTKISAGCENCYAARMHARLRAMGQRKYAHPFNEVVVHPEEIIKPLKWKKSRMVFVCSMSDIFSADVPHYALVDIFDVMNRSQQHTFQVLTKRSTKMAAYCNYFAGMALLSPNIWIGVTVENQQNRHRIADLITVPAAVRFLSCEPLLGPLHDLDLTEVGWVIVGGETGPGARTMDPRWADDIRQQCAAAGVPFFFKHIGGVRKTPEGRKLFGKIYHEMPNRGNHEEY